MEANCFLNVKDDSMSTHNEILDGCENEEK